MTEFLSKLENFLFDILGLILPGFIFICFITLPFLLIDLITIPPNEIEKYKLYFTIATISVKIKEFLKFYPNYFGIILAISSYIAGHFIKVFSIIIYEYLVAIMDKTLIPLVQILLRRIQNIINIIFIKTLNKTLYNLKIYTFIKTLLTPSKNFLNKIFQFKAPDYMTDNQELLVNCIKIINERLNVNYPDKWYSVYKFSSIVGASEKTKSLAATFLAKYNLYRSLSFIFMFNVILYLILFKLSSPYLKPQILFIKEFIIIPFSLLWFTFHYKFKRYWTLCGNESLVSLFYFLNKAKING